MSSITLAGTRGPSRPASPALRITARGRLVLLLLVALPLAIAALFAALNGGAATAAAEGPAATFEYVTVEPGQTLWQVAGEVAPSADPRDVIAEIKKLNALSTSSVQPGQELAIPLQYTR